MIATCPHCQSGFYIASDLAGAVVICSKCKKQVRAPDRRGHAPGPLSQTNDGIPVAILAETRAEAEEHIKNETEARFELEKKIKDSLDAKAKAEFQAKIDAQARQEAEERLKQEVSARATIEAKLLTEIDAGRKAEESAMAEKQARENFEEKLKTETEARLKADVQVEAISRELAEVKAKLTEAEDARKETETRVVKEAEAKGQLEQRLQAETESKIKAESQAKTEALAKKKYQSQAESGAAAIIKLEQELEAVKTRIRDAKIAASKRSPINITKGFVRLTFILSLVAAGAGGYIAYINGYIINSHYDRPMHLPMFPKAVYLPVNLIAISVGSYLAVWVAFLTLLFVIKGFSRPNSAKIQTITRSEPMVEETYVAGEGRMWRSP
ncbi:MAG: MJ0042-type zinc finger domain-containing protein [Sedimentisphaerales bacterium]